MSARENVQLWKPATTPQADRIALSPSFRVLCREPVAHCHVKLCAKIHISFPNISGRSFPPDVSRAPQPRATTDLLSSAHGVCDISHNKSISVPTSQRCHAGVNQVGRATCTFWPAAAASTFMAAGKAASSPLMHQTHWSAKEICVCNHWIFKPSH